MVSIRKGLNLSYPSKRNVSSTTAEMLENAALTGNPGRDGKRLLKPEENNMMGYADFSNLYLLAETATHLAENRAKRVKVNAPPEQQNAEMREARGAFQTLRTSSGQHYMVWKGEQAIPTDEMSRELPARQLLDNSPKTLKPIASAVQLQMGPIPKMKVKTIAAVQPPVRPIRKRKVRTTTAVPPLVRPRGTLKVHHGLPKTLKVQTTGQNSMVADQNTPTRLDRHGIAVYNKSSCCWTAYIWDGTEFYSDDSVKTPKINADIFVKTSKKTAAHLLEIRNGVCLPDRTKLSLQGINFYKGVGRWTAHIWHRKQFYVGEYLPSRPQYLDTQEIIYFRVSFRDRSSYGSATEAARAYDKASLKHFDSEASQPNYRGIYDYSADIKEMATMTSEAYRVLLNEQAKLSKRVYVSEGVTTCPEGRFEVKIKLAKNKWEFFGRFDDLEDAKRWYQMVSRWYDRGTSNATEAS